MSDLLSLAERFVALEREIGEVRRAMLAALTNGAGESRPFARPARLPRKRTRPNERQAAAAEAKILDLLRDRPMRTAEIAQATAAQKSTTLDRLRRLRERGQVQGGGAEGWRAAAG